MGNHAGHAADEGRAREGLLPLCQRPVRLGKDLHDLIVVQAIDAAVATLADDLAAARDTSHRRFCTSMSCEKPVISKISKASGDTSMMERLPSRLRSLRNTLGPMLEM